MSEARAGWLTVIGVGPGSPEHLTPAARAAAGQASYLIGGARALGLFEDLPAGKYRLSGDLEGLASFLTRIKGQPTAVLVSGDPGFYSLLGWLKRRFPGEAIAVIPGISSVQLAFARLARGWEGVTFLSLHGRDLALLEPHLPGLRQGTARLALLTGGSNSPAAIGRYLAGQGLGACPAWLGVDLGLAGERCYRLPAGELAGLTAPDGVVVLGDA